MKVQKKKKKVKETEDEDNQKSITGKASLYISIKVS